MTYKALNGLASSYLEKFSYVFRRHKYTLTLRNSEVNLMLPRLNTECWKNSLVMVEQYYGIRFLVTLGGRETCVTFESSVPNIQL